MYNIFLHWATFPGGFMDRRMRQYLNLCQLIPKAPSGVSIVWWFGAPALGSDKPRFHFNLWSYLLCIIWGGFTSLSLTFLKIWAKIINFSGLVIRVKYNTTLGLNFRPIATLVIKVLTWLSLSSLLYKTKIVATIWVLVCYLMLNIYSFPSL